MRLDFETSAAEEVDFAVSDLDFLNNSFSADDCSQKIQAGIKAAREGSRANARLLLLEAADGEPNDEEVWLRLASVSEYPEELLVFLKNALGINPSNERAREWAKATERVLAANFAERGARAFEENQTDFARQCFRQSITLEAENETALFGLARAADSDAERNEIFERILTFSPENETALNALSEAKSRTVERLLSKATAEAFAGDYDSAEDTLEAIFDETPDSEDAWLLKVFLAASFDEKNECWEEVLRINPENELARAGTAYMRSLKLKLVSPLEKEIQEKLALSDAEESNFFVKETLIENTIDLAKIYAEYSSVEAEDLSTAATSDDSETFEISVDDEEDLSGCYEIVEENSLTDSMSAAEAEDADEMQSKNYKENPMSEETLFSASGEVEGVENNVDEKAAHTIACPFCSRENESQVFVCPSCSAVLTLSDLEMLLAHSDANQEIVRQAVERMEAEMEFSEYGANELKFLGVGQINLKHFRRGFSYLQQAVQTNPNDVVLSAQVNALAIRLAEIEEQASIHSSMPKNKTILVVDDSATVRKLISGKLEKSGHAVLCAVDGMDAMEKIEANVPDLILLDITMPRMDGYTVCKMIRTNERTKDIPVVMISGKDGFFDKVRGRMAGTTGYITKPFGPETLMKTVESYIV